ncbi:MAG: acyl-CoA dehydrogenase family protein [Pseudomonadota bacterium]|nr:acyl-CoA dehydrogenase family protein [Pseudomonadota bacterium]
MTTTEPTSPISFAVSPDLQAFIDAAQAVARDIDLEKVSQRDSASSLDQGLQAIAALNVDALLEGMEAPERPTVMLHLAYTLGAARPEVAWQGLLSALEQALLQALGSAQPQDTGASTPGPASVRIAWPLRTENGLQRWVYWQSASAEAARFIYFLQVDEASQNASVSGPCSLADLQTHFSVEIESPLMGLPSGMAMWLCAKPEAPALHPAPASDDANARAAVAAVLRQYQALLMGLLAGMTQRASLAAYAYARTRQSAGKPLLHHQAVALRLADIAMNQQALWLYAQACFGGNVAGVALSSSYVSELAGRVTRDAVQTAGAHGYVEGLPFKRLFEQTRTVLTGLTALSNTAFETAT